MIYHCDFMWEYIQMNFDDFPPDIVSRLLPVLAHWKANNSTFHKHYSIQCIHPVINTRFIGLKRYVGWNVSIFSDVLFIWALFLLGLIVEIYGFTI